MSFNKSAVFAAFILACTLSFAQDTSVGINTNSPNENAVLELVSPNSNQGFLVPRLTSAQRNSMSLNNLDNASRIDLDNGSYSSDNGSSFSGVGTEQDALAEYFKAFHDNETVGVTADSLDNYTRITAE